MEKMSSGRIVLLTLLALLCFAANSILCRLALAEGLIDPGSFTVVRLVSGAVALALLVRIRSGAWDVESGNWWSTLFLLGYAVAFAYAYLEIGAGTGALILFGSVQATMLIYEIASGRKPTGLEWLGLLVAVSGLVYLLSPGLSAPPLLSAGLMALAGIAWGGYSLKGKGSKNAAADTAGNFLRAASFSILLAFVIVGSGKLSGEGVGLAVLSGAVTSGLGYFIWYLVLPSLAATRAAIVQLLVPVLAAVGGLILLGEEPTLRLVLAGSITILGVSLALFGKVKSLQKKI